MLYVYKTDIEKQHMEQSEVEMISRFSPYLSPSERDQLLKHHSDSEKLNIEFSFRFTKYKYDSYNKVFVPVEFHYDGNIFSTKPVLKTSFKKIHDTFEGGVSEGFHYRYLLQLFGGCNIVLPEKSNMTLLIEECLHPFFVFQFFSWCLWYYNNYYIYATCILFTTGISLIVELLDIKANLQTLKQMVDYHWKIKVVRKLNDNEEVVKEVSSDDLVPGDIIFVPEGIKMPCDAILLSGASIVNEAMLTGESVPVIKNELPYVEHMTYDPMEDKIYTLYSGTEVIQNRKIGKKDVLALVTKTNYDTLKGGLIKSILYPKPHRFNFTSDSVKFLGIMGIFALIGFWITLPENIKVYGAIYSIVRLLDLITITVPPALPAAMSIGVVYALSRLRQRNIYCISPPCINVAGRVKTMVFDKTGTLTEDGLTFAGITIPQYDECFHQLDKNWDLINKVYRENILHFDENIDTTIETKTLGWMVTCHCIAEVKGHFIGDPLDIEMFKATGWTLDERSHHGELWSFYNESLSKLIYVDFNQLFFL